MKDSSYLRGHRYFRDLNPGELDELAGFFSLFRGRAGAVLIPAGAPVEGLYLLEEGILKGEDGKGNDRVYTRGDTIGEDALFSPYAASGPVSVLEECRVLYLARSDYLLWKSRRPKGVKRLALPTGKDGPVKGAVLRESRIFWLAKTLPSLIFPPLFLARLLLRRRNGTFVEGDKLIFRYFRWKSLKNINLTIPLEQIQSVESGQKGLLSRLMKTGDLLVRVDGSEGHVLVKNIPRPREEQERILTLKRRAEETARAAKHRRIRRDIARWIRKEEGIELIEEGKSDNGAPKRKSSLFHRSLFVLLAQIWWLIILAGGCGGLYWGGKISSADWVQLPLAAVMILAGLILYRLVDWANDLFKVEGGYLLDVNRKPLGEERTSRQAELSAIQNVIAEQKGLWANLFDYGDIRIILSGSGQGLLWEGMKHPRRVQERILFERRAWLDGLEEKERLSQQEDLMLYCRFLSQELSEKNRSS